MGIDMNDLFVGKDVWYRPRSNEAGPYPGTNPLAAIVTYIHANGDLNLFVFGMDGSTHGLCGIPFYEGDTRPQLPGYAEPQKTGVPGAENPRGIDDDMAPENPSPRRRRRVSENGDALEER